MAMAMLAVSAAVSAVGSIYAGNAQAAQATAAADAANANAHNVRLQTNAREEQQRMANALQLGELRANAAQTGFDPSSGTLARLQSASAAQLELDALTGRYNGELQSLSLDNEAKSLRNQGKAAKVGGYLSAFGSIAKSAGNYYGMSAMGS